MASSTTMDFLDAAGKTMMAAGTGMVVFGVVGNMPPASYVGFPASAAMVSGLAGVGLGAALSIASKSF